MSQAAPLAGRSTTWWRVIPALFTPPLVLGALYLMSVTIWEGAKRLIGGQAMALALDPGTLIMFAVMSMMFVGPCVLIAALIWIVLHRRSWSGPTHAAVLGAAMGALGFLAMRFWLVGDNLRAPWILWLMGAGALAGLVVWAIAYAGRPEKALRLVRA